MSLDGAIRLYEGFHQFEPKKIGKFPGGGLVVPEKGVLVGCGSQILYRSAKFNPANGKDEGVQEYFHDHKPGVRYCRFDTDDGVPKRIPKWIRETDTVSFIGKCVGFTYVNDDGEEVVAKGTNPLPEIYAIPPHGKALLLVQGRRSVIAAIWGGRLHVEPRGIIG